MKKVCKLLCLGALGTALAIPLSSYGQDEPGRWYIKGDVGGNWTTDTDLNEYFGAAVGGAKVKFDPGLRMGVAGGYNFTEFFALEGELGLLANSIDKVTGASRADADFSNVPLFVNAKLKYPNKTAFVPYIGAGVGFSASIMDVEDLQIGSIYMSGTEADLVFAYQAVAGVRYNLNEQMALGVEYHYFGSDKPSWDADVTFGTASNSLGFGRINTHAFSLVFRFAF